MINSKGIPHGITGTKLFRINDKSDFFGMIGNCISIATGDNRKSTSKWVLSDGSCIKSYQSGVTNINQNFLDSLKSGDIVSIRPNGDVNVLWQVNHDDNLLFLTDYCNSHCLMCPQTQVNNPDNYYDVAINILKLVKDTPKYLCISGGEPTFMKNRYVDVVKEINAKYPQIALQVLTNGKNFSDFNFAKQCVVNSPIDTLYGIPLYSGNSSVHDAIVNSQGSFNKTIKGIINLYRLRQNIEIRIVITKQNYKDLPNIAHFIYWNLPFVFRIAFMGMETHGAAEENLEKVWIESADYVDYLSEAVQFLDDRLMNVMIYNLPHCILPPALRKFAQDSISAWKKTFPDICPDCKYVKVCSGVFATSKQIPKGIHRI